MISSETLQVHLLMDLKYGILKNYVANQCSHIHIRGSVCIISSDNVAKLTSCFPCKLSAIFGAGVSDSILSVYTEVLYAVNMNSMVVLNHILFPNILTFHRHFEHENLPFRYMFYLLTLQSFLLLSFTNPIMYAKRRFSIHRCMLILNLLSHRVLLND